MNLHTAGKLVSVISVSYFQMALSRSMTTVLITGCSRGIGAGLVAEALHQSSAFVIATCRSPSSSAELKKLSEVYKEDRLLILPLDTTSVDSYKTAVENLSSKGITSIDVLIANAGISNPDHPSDPILTCSTKTMMDVFETNCVGTLLTLQNFTPLLEKGSVKLCVLLSSRLASIEQAEGVGGYTSYRASKAAMNMLAMTYTEDRTVKEANIRTLCMHPGWVQTDMGERGGRKASVTIADCARGIHYMISRATAVQLETKESMHTAVDTADQDQVFERTLRTHRCAFTAFDGEMLPW